VPLVDPPPAPLLPLLPDVPEPSEPPDPLPDELTDKPWPDELRTEPDPLHAAKESTHAAIKVARRVCLMMMLPEALLRMTHLL
jgi:hypothetical protein